MIKTSDIYCNIRVIRVFALRALPWLILHEPRVFFLMLRLWWVLGKTERTLLKEVEKEIIDAGGGI